MLHFCSHSNSKRFALEPHSANCTHQHTHAFIYQRTPTCGREKLELNPQPLQSLHIQTHQLLCGSSPGHKYFYIATSHFLLSQAKRHCLIFLILHSMYLNVHLFLVVVAHNHCKRPFSNDFNDFL